jgi:hypothetical protein
MKDAKFGVYIISSISRIYSEENKYCPNIQMHAPKELFYAEDLLHLDLVI